MLAILPGSMEPGSWSLPMVGGIDLVGRVLDGGSSGFGEGEWVLANGWGLSELHWGGYSQWQRLDPDWLIRVPDPLTPFDRMAIGTAGYTAMLCVMELEHHDLLPGDGDVIVTGAAGGATLANLLAQMRYGASAAACGLAGGSGLPGSVLPFILRGVRLLGVDSVMAPRQKREAAWARLAAELDTGELKRIARLEPMSKLPELAPRILAGEVRGRVVIDVNFSLFCDYRVMNKRAGRTGITEVRGGMMVGRHVTYALARIVGEHRAQQLILGATVLDARQARAQGLADELASPRFVVGRAVAWCDRVLQQPRDAMLKSRTAARAGIRRVLAEIEAEPIENRVREWFADEAQANLRRLIKA